MSAKRYVLQTLMLIIIGLCALGAITIYYDPLFHYHAPIKGVEYPITNQRYQNDGIIRNFEYDAIIIGSSMTENFKASEFNELFEVESIKVPLSGTTLKEAADRLERAFLNNDVDYVIRSLDYYAIVSDKDLMSENFEYPNYLYDDNYFNDVKYIFNKNILFDYTFKTIRYSREGNITTTFDEYSYWSDWFTYGKNRVLTTFSRDEKVNTVASLSKTDIDRISENILQNVIAQAENNPKTEFYLFFPPYSIFYWDQWKQNGYVDAGIDVYKLVTKLLLNYDNVHIFSFFDCYDLICDLNNYKDIEHYGGWVNSEMLLWMKKGNHELTVENYEKHFEELRAFYNSYNYDELY